jgi:manganese-dependent ADP-ribose/CDP-alcohol diphosphatase
MKRRNFIKITLPLFASNSLLAKNADSGKPELTFGVIADPQYADADTRGTRFYRNSLAKLTSAVKELNQHSLEFTVTLGDVIDKNLKSFDDILPIYKTAKAPQTFVLGNHDFTVADEDKSKVLPKLGLEKAYYSQTVGNWHFIYLDGNAVSTYRYPKDSEQTKSAKKMRDSFKKAPKAPYSGWLGDTQVQWLNEELAKAAKANKRVIVFNHFPIFPTGDGYNLWNDSTLVDLLTSHKHVVAYMNGHKHSGNYAAHKGCHFINFKGMVETEKATPYAIVKCFADRIEIDGFGTEPDRKLSSNTK